MLFLLLSDIVVHGYGDTKIQVCHGCHGCHNVSLHSNKMEVNITIHTSEIRRPSSSKVKESALHYQVGKWQVGLSLSQRISLLASLSAQFHGFLAPKT